MDACELIVRRTKWYECTEVFRCQMGREINKSASSCIRLQKLDPYTATTDCLHVLQVEAQTSARCDIIYSVASIFHCILLDSTCSHTHQVWKNDRMMNKESEWRCRGRHTHWLHFTSFHTIKLQQSTACNLYGSLLLSPPILFCSIYTIMEHFIT